MRVAFVTVLCSGILLCGLAQADLKPGTYAPDLEAAEWLNTDGQAISLAELRGMIVLLFFFGPETRGDVLAMMTQLNGSRFGQARGVYMVGLADAERKRVEELLKKEKVYFPVGLEARKSFTDYDLKSGPRVVLIDIVGKVAWSGWPTESADRGASRLADEITKVAEQTPPVRTHPELAAKAQAYLKQARQALRSERFREAYEAAERAFGLALSGDKLKTRGQDMLDLIEALGRDRLARADRAMDEQRYEEAAALLVEVRREFRGIDAGSAARRKIDTLRKRNAEIARALDQHENVGQAETLLDAAMDHLRARRFGAAYEKLEEITGEYAATPTAAKAQTVIDRMQKNETIMAYVRDHKAAGPCRTLLFQANSFANTGQFQRARDLYREVIEKYPDTIYAREAARRLAQLP